MKNKYFLGAGLLIASASLMAATNVHASTEQENYEKYMVKDVVSYSHYQTTDYGRHYNHDYFGLKRALTYYPSDIISNIQKTTGAELEKSQITKFELNYKDVLSLKKEITAVDVELRNAETLKENHLQVVLNIVYERLPLGKKVNETYKIDSSNMTVYIETTQSSNNFQRRIMFFQNGIMIYNEFLPMKDYPNVKRVANDGIYSDVSSSHWASSYIADLSKLGIVNGSNGEYKPNNSITRGQFAAMLSRTLPKATPITNISIFKDVTNSNWAKDDIHLLYEMGIITGYSDETFKPNEPITRQQAVAMIGRYFNALNMTVQTPLVTFSSEPSIFADRNKIAAYAAIPVEMLYQLEVISGSKNEKGEVVFNPTGNLTRAQMAKILYNSLQLKSKVIQ